MAEFTVEPSNIAEGWDWQVVRDDGVLVGLHQTKARAQAFADRGGEPYPVEFTSRDSEDEGQFDLFGGGA